MNSVSAHESMKAPKWGKWESRRNSMGREMAAALNVERSCRRMHGSGSGAGSGGEERVQ